MLTIISKAVEWAVELPMPITSGRSNRASRKHTSSRVQFEVSIDFEEEHYNLEVIEVSNLALAIKNREPTISIEISLGCENLP